MFDRRNPEAHFVDLAKLKETRDPKTYIFEFLKISIMVPYLSTTIRVCIFIDELREPFHKLVESTRTTTI